MRGDQKDRREFSVSTLTNKNNDHPSIAESLANIRPEPVSLDVLISMADHRVNRIDELLPWNINPTFAEVST